MQEFNTNIINIFKDIFSFNKKKFKKQIPNLLTLTRVILLPFTISFFLNEQYLVAIIFLIISAISDFFDGRYARKNNISTSFGALLDAVCDKMFAYGVITALLVKKPNGFSPLSIILFLEIVIMFINTYYKSRGINVSSTIYGKVKTTTMYITLIIYFISNFIKINNLILLIFSIITIISQIIAIISYFLKYKKEVKNDFKRSI